MLNKLDRLNDIALKYGSITEGARKEISQLKEEIVNFRAYVPFMGIFTVGKSSLLNTWLGEDLLPEAQGATTALATELIPGAVSRMVIVENDGSERSLQNLPTDEDEANSPEASNGIYAYCLSPSVNLRNIFPIVPVDMPGVNSGIKRHTEAIYRYANRGCAFFLIFMPEEGTLPLAMKAFLQELNLDGRPVWMVMNKCDTADDEKISNVINAILVQLKTINIEPAGVLRCERGDEQTAIEMQNAFLSLNVDELNEQTHQEEALRAALRLKDQIASFKESENLDTSELDRQIRMCERAHRDLRESLAKEEVKLSKKLSSLPSSVGDDVFTALNANLGVLVVALESGEEVFATRLTGIINNVVANSIDKKVEKDFGEISESLAHNLNREYEEIFNAERISAGVGIATKTLGGLAKLLKNIKSGKKIYKVVTTALALTTSVIAPVVELIIIFLPELLSLFGNREEAKRERIREELKGRVFPQVQNSIINEVEKMLPELRDELIEALRNEWLGRIEDAQAALEAAISGKDSALSAHKQNVAEYEKDIQSISAILKDIRANAPRRP